MPILVLSLFGFVRLLLSGHVAIAMENAALRVSTRCLPAKTEATHIDFLRPTILGGAVPAVDRLRSLVLDLKMPGMNGLDVQRVVSVQISTAIIFITGRGDIPSTVKAMQGGAVDFLTKPIDATVLMAAVEQALQKDRIARQQALEGADLLARYRSLTAWEEELLPPLVQGLLNK
jgi:FixJ family two-component response regulator